VLRIFIALKNPSPWPVSNPRPLSPAVRTLTTTPLMFQNSVDKNIHNILLSMVESTRILVNNILKQIKLLER
jgi:hypothetical protein